MKKQKNIQTQKDPTDIPSKYQIGASCLSRDLYKVVYI